MMNIPHEIHGQPHAARRTEPSASPGADAGRDATRGLAAQWLPDPEVDDALRRIVARHVALAQFHPGPAGVDEGVDAMTLFMRRVRRRRLVV